MAGKLRPARTPTGWSVPQLGKGSCRREPLPCFPGCNLNAHGAGNELYQGRQSAVEQHKNRESCMQVCSPLVPAPPSRRKSAKKNSKKL